jgi:hypothetical protein
MKRWSCAVGAGLLLALIVAAPAAAQYADPTTTTTSTTSTTLPEDEEPERTTTTLPPTTTTDAPPPASVPAKTSNPTPQAGDSVPVSVPASGGAPVIDASKPSAAVLLPADGSADVPMPAPRITVNANGSISVSVTIPPSTPPGVYLIAVVGTDASGRSRAIIVPIVVRRIRAAAIAADAPIGPLVAATLPAETRSQVARLRTSVAAAGGADVIERQVLEEGATLEFDGAELVLSTRDLGSEETSGSRPLVAAFAVALGGAGLVLVRRRTPAISRRTK